MSMSAPSFLNPRPDARIVDENGMPTPQFFRQLATLEATVNGKRPLRLPEYATPDEPDAAKWAGHVIVLDGTIALSQGGAWVKMEVAP
jgi:hypothetical protein